jgi:hypothetical protein
MPACSKFDNLDQFFDKAAASEVTHVENKKLQQQQQQQQQHQPKQPTDLPSTGGKPAYRPSISKPGVPTGSCISGQSGSKRLSISGGEGQSEGNPPALWVSAEIIEG